jgi:hypothetical protein
MTSEPTPDPPTEPPDQPERRIRRGCLAIIFLLVLIIALNFVQYRINIVAIVAGVLLAAAVAAFVLISREGRR